MLHSHIALYQHVHWDIAVSEGDSSRSGTNRNQIQRT